MAEPSLNYNEFRRQLLERRAEIADDRRAMRQDASGGEGGGSHLPLHLADAASDTQDQTFAWDRLSAASATLQEIDAALERLDQGIFGICEECGEPIAERRLRLMPHAALCIKCQAQEEKS